MKKDSSLFIHATFRTCSTWWWAKFRNQPDVRAFYEPLHHNLSNRTHMACNKSHNEKDKSVLYRHPSVTDHYFNEYPLLDTGGLDLYNLRFAFDNYVLSKNDNDQELKEYVQSLMNTAIEDNQKPVLKFNRSTLRAEWLKAQFGGDHIYLNRSPQNIMNSVRSFLKPKEGEVSNADFSAFFLMIVGQNSEHPAFKEIANEYNIHSDENSNWDENINHFKSRALEMSDQDLQDIVGFIWLSGLAHASKYADIIIDQDLMANNNYRISIENKIQNISGIDISLSDFRPHRASETDFCISEKMQRLIKKAMPYISHDVDNIESMEISDSSKNILKYSMPN